jgi:hypothetical protein
MDEHHTPLGRYLEKAGVTNADFAARLSRIDGRTISATTVSMWKCALRVPGFNSRRLIASATAGAIGPKDWEKVSVRKPRSSRRSKLRRTG